MERAALALSAAAPLAAAAPTIALNELTATPLLRTDGGQSGNGYYSSSGGGDALGSLGSGALASLRAPDPTVGLAMFERAVLPAECAAGEYPLTLALLRLTEALLWAGAGSSPAMTPLLQHVLQEVLVQHGLWRYRRRADRWQVHAAAVGVVTAALAPRPGPGNAARRAAVAGFVSGDAGAAAAALAPLTLDPAALRRMHEESSGVGRGVEVAAAEDAVAATLRMLPPLLCVLTDSMATATVAAASSSSRLFSAAPAPPPPLALRSGPLARALLVEAPGGGAPLVAAVAAYAAYPYAAACWPLALPALAAVCSAAPEEPPLVHALPALAAPGKPRTLTLNSQPSTLNFSP